MLATLGLEPVDNLAWVAAEKLGNQTSANIDLTAAEGEPVVASIYQLDGLVRRAPALQLTADARPDAPVAATPTEALP